MFFFTLPRSPAWFCSFLFLSFFLYHVYPAGSCILLFLNLWQCSVSFCQPWNTYIANISKLISTIHTPPQSVIWLNWGQRPQWGHWVQKPNIHWNSIRTMVMWLMHTVWISLTSIYKTYGSKILVRVIWGHRGQNFIFTDPHPPK